MLNFMAEQTQPSSDTPDLNSPIQIGVLTCRNRVFLAPMSGVTDVPFRKMAWKHGAGMVFSEMVASEALVTGKSEMITKSQSADLPVHAVQIAGREAQWMALAAKLARDNGADIIDINMGCPSRRVTSGLSGSALMRDLDHAMGLIEAVIGAVDVPVTLKMRLGWDENSINAPELANRAQAAGVAMISVHGRTRCQFYNGEADWAAVRAVREVIDLPLIVNGDIFDANSARQAMRLSEADGVMIGRACYGKPWLAGQIAHGISTDVDLEKIAEIACEHLEESLMHLETGMAIRHFRKHLGWYLDAIGKDKLCPQLRRKLVTSVVAEEITSMITEAFQTNSATEAA